MISSNHKSLFLLLVNSNLLTHGSVGMRAKKVITYLEEDKRNNLIVISRDRSFQGGENLKHYSYFYVSFIFKALKFFRVKIYSKFPDRYFESIFLDLYATLICKLLRLKEYQNKTLISFESAPLLIAESRKKDFLCIQDVQILPLSFAKDLFEEGTIENFPNTFLFNQLLKRELKAFTVADYLVCPSKFVNSYLIKTLNKTKESLFICPFGVDIKKFEKLQNQRLSKNMTGGLSFGFLGQISERKGVKFLLKAFTDELFNKDSLFIGGETQKTNIDFEPAHYNQKNIHFLGNVNPIDFFKKIDVLIHPSLIEGSAKVVYEAMAAGVLPIVTENTGSIIDNNIDGLIIKACSSDDIKEKMSYVKENFPNNEMKENIQKKISKFSWDDYAKRYYEILKTVNGIEIKN